MTAQISTKTQDALASIEQSERNATAAGHAVIGGVMTYGEAVLGDGLFAKASGAAKWFVLWFGMIVPVYLFWTVAL